MLKKMIALVIIIIAVSVMATAVVTLSLTKTASEADRQFNKKIEQESPDFSQERNALFLFLPVTWCTGS